MGLLQVTKPPYKRKKSNFSFQVNKYSVATQGFNLIWS